MPQKTRASLVQVMVCRLFGAMPLPEPLLDYEYADCSGFNVNGPRISYQVYKWRQRWWIYRILQVPWRIRSSSWQHGLHGFRDAARQYGCRHACCSSDALADHRDVYQPHSHQRSPNCSLRHAESDPPARWFRGNHSIGSKNHDNRPEVIRVRTVTSSSERVESHIEDRYFKRQLQSEQSTKWYGWRWRGVG